MKRNVWGFRSVRRHTLSLLLAAASLAYIGGPVKAADVSPAADWERFATPKADQIIVHKAARKLELLRGGAVLRTYRIALGSAPVGKKLVEGDGKTPEGRYVIDRRNMLSDYYLALHISYPDQDDVQQAALNHVDPGGAIMIHGQPSYLTVDERGNLKKDWTAGCIALSNAEIAEVWRLVDDGTEILIYP